MEIYKPVQRLDKPAQTFKQEASVDECPRVSKQSGNESQITWTKSRNIHKCNYTNIKTIQES